MDLTPNKGAGNSIALKPYTTNELAKLYGISVYTFYKWIEPFKTELGKKLGWYWTIPQVRLIFQKLDVPAPYFNPEN